MLTIIARKHLDGSVIILNNDETVKAVFPWWHKSKPDYRFKYLMLNCYKYKIDWDMEADYVK